MQMRYLSPAEGDICEGTKLPPSCSFHEWVNEMNSFFQSGLKDFRSQPLWRKDRSRGGEALLCLTSTPACFRRSVVVESLLEGGMPTSLYTEVAEFLLSGGIKAVFCGHKPCGDSPFVVRSRVTFIHCDTTYSDVKASDQRGRAVAAVEASLGATPEVLLRGILADGRKYDFSLLGNDADDLVGFRMTDGGYVKAKLLDESDLKLATVKCFWMLSTVEFNYRVVHRDEKLYILYNYIYIYIYIYLFIL